MPVCLRVAKAALLLFATLWVSTSVFAQSNAPAFACNATAGVPPIIRAEGQTELVGDLILNCTGGAPSGSGATVPQASVTLYFGTNATSKTVAPGFSEALLLIDEPGTTVMGSGTLLPCGAAGSNDNGSGVCSITSDGVVADTYNGTPGHPNVFQGQQVGGNAITWSNVPIDGPGENHFRILRFTNLRVNASEFGAGSAQTPTQIVAFVEVSGITINNPQQLVAYGQSSLIESTSAAAVLSQCVNANPSIASNASLPLDTGGQNGAQFLVSQTSQFATVFRPKNYAQTQANAGPPFLTLYPADSNQDLPGYSYNTETGFFAGSMTNPILPGLPNLLPQPEFPSTQGLNVVGSASNGTRVYFQFTGVPAGLQLYVPVSIPLFLPLGSQTGIAALTTTDANGAGPFTAVAGNSSELARLTVSGTTAMAVYEILYADSSSPSSLTLPVAAAYLANQVSAATVNVQSGLAPLGLMPNADGTSPVPRFVSVATATPAFSIAACSQAIGSTTTASSLTVPYSPTGQSVSLTALVTSSKGGVTGGTVTFSAAGGPVVSAAVTGGTANASYAIPALAVGAYPITAEFSGEGSVVASSDNSKVLTVSKVQPILTWAAPASINLGESLSSVQLNATAPGIPGTYVYQPPAGTVLSMGNNQKLSVTFTPTNTAGYLSATATTTINVLAAGIPFGSFDTPAAISNVNGAVPFTGWALASAGIASVDIWREPNPGEVPASNGLVFLGTSDLVAGARPDVQTLYPGYPGNNSAGWGFQMLTNELPSNSGNTGVGNGTFNVHALAYDNDGNVTDLGTKTIVVDNKNSVNPFGAIDTPTQGGTASGSQFVNFGWALTPVGKEIPVDGSTIWVFIDNVPVGHPVYNNYRVDIATLFPGYANSGGAIGYYLIDTTQLANGVHSIAWSVTDNADAGSGIGSRFFTVQNP